MKDAIQDLIDTLKTLGWVNEVLTEERDVSAANYRLTVLLGNYDNLYAINQITSRNQEIIVRLDAKKGDSIDLVEKMQAVDDKLRVDVRRDSNAQTTICPGWEKITQDRDGARFETTILIKKNEI